MGKYIRPKNGESKESWLMYHGRRCHEAPQFDPGSDLIPVCLVDNDLFTAAAICDSSAEHRRFTSPDDYRPKQWWLVPRKSLVEWL